MVGPATLRGTLPPRRANGDRAVPHAGRTRQPRFHHGVHGFHGVFASRRPSPSTLFNIACCGSLPLGRGGLHELPCTPGTPWFNCTVRSPRPDKWQRQFHHGVHGSHGVFASKRSSSSTLFSIACCGAPPLGRGCLHELQCTPGTPWSNHAVVGLTAARERQERRQPFHHGVHGFHGVFVSGDHRRRRSSTFCCGALPLGRGGLHELPCTPGTPWFNDAVVGLTAARERRERQQPFHHGVHGFHGVFASRRPSPSTLFNISCCGSLPLGRGGLHELRCTPGTPWSNHAVGDFTAASERRERQQPFTNGVHGFHGEFATRRPSTST